MNFTMRLLRRAGSLVSLLGCVKMLVLDDTSMEEGTQWGKIFLWAIRGGGGVSFGVIVSRKIKVVLNPVTRKGQKTIKAKFNALFLGNVQELLNVMNAGFPQMGLVPEQVGASVLQRHVTTKKYLKKKSDYVQQPFPKLALKDKTKADPNNFFRYEQSIPLLAFVH
ncbi:hypothetical protein VNO78_03842 [Psophocarpus tetragonolobus]|uniref:Berberine/berberine-like domain-containing protein n=1 Tax=Psophocarpus tetragonolobus TaxID=3891 RepID=A0AAN9T181_PSOTE